MSSRTKSKTIAAVPVALLLVCMGIADSLQAQERTARVYGVVKDNTGAVIPGATVVVTHADKGVKTVLVTNDAGIFNAPKLVTGTYQVDAELTGFKKFQRTGMLLLPGDAVEVNINLEIGQLSEVVTVTEQTPLVNTSSGTSKMSLETALIDTMPLNARDANQLVKLTPGAVVDYTNTVHINGIDQYQNIFSIDGTSSRDQHNHTQVMAPTPDALQEFSVETNYSAEYGQGSGAAVLLVTKSGTNQLHGSVYDYFRAENLNANSFQRNYFNQGKSDFKRHQLGFTVGGPVLIPKIWDGRDKSFFFFSGQWLKEPSTPYLAGIGGLTAAEKRGDFSQSAVIPVVSRAWSNAANSPFAGMEGQRVTNLAPYLSPIALRLYKTFHEDREVPYSGWFTWESESAGNHLPEYVIRGDHTIKGNNTVSFSMFYKHRYGDPTRVEFDPKTWRRSSRWKTQKYSIADVWTLNPTMMNELRLGYLRNWQYSQGTLPGDTDFDSFLDPNYGGNDGLGWSGINLVHYTMDPNYFSYRPQVGTTNSEGRGFYDAYETFSFSWGKHYMKAGATVIIDSSYGYKSAQAPQYYFRGSFVGAGLGNDTAEYMIGWPSSANFSQGQYYPTGKEIFSAFFQDDWKISPRLSLNLGLRYEPYFFGYTKQVPGSIGTILFKPFVQSTVYPTWPVGYLTYGDPDYIGKSGIENDNNNWAPRVGFAYRLNDTGTRVLRGAYGLFFNDACPLNETGALARSVYPFIHNYSTTYESRYPGANDAYLDVPTYVGVTPKPNFATPPDIANAFFDPKTAYGGSGGLYPPKVGSLHQWNLTFENEFRPGWMYSVGYQAHGAWKSQWMADYWNLPILRGDGTDSWDVENLASRRPIQEYRYQTRTFNVPKGDSEYHGLNLKLQARTYHFRMHSWYALARQRDHIDAFREAVLGRGIRDR